MDTRLQQRLTLVARRLYFFQVGWSLAVVWIVAAAIGWGLLRVANTGDVVEGLCVGVVRDYGRCIVGSVVVLAAQI